MIINKEKQKKSVEKKIYEPIQGYECLSASLINQFSWYNIFINSGQLYFNTAPGVICYDINQRRIHLPIQSASFDFLKKNSIFYFRGKCEEIKRAEELLSSRFKSGRILTIKVNPNKLTYTQAFRLNQGVPHHLNILGEKKNEIYICDNYVPNFKASIFEGWVSKNMIYEAWKQYNYSYIEIIDLSKVDLRKIHEDSKRGFVTWLESFFGLIDNVESDGKIYGEQAAYRMFSDFEQALMRDMISSREISEFFFRLKVDGLLMEKRFIYEMIIELKLKSCVASYDMMLKQWDKVLFVLHLNISEREKNENRIRDIFCRIKNLIAEERKILEQIYITVKKSGQ